MFAHWPMCKHLIHYPPNSLKAGYTVHSILRYRLTGLIPSRSWCKFPF